MDYGGQFHSIRGWTSRSPQTWKADGYSPIQAGFASLAEGTCPAISDPRYMQTMNVSDGMLKAFHQAWIKAISSPRAFDKAFAALAVRSGFSQTFLGTVRNGALQGRVRLEGMRCGDDGCMVWAGLVFIQFDLVDSHFALPDFTQP
jgi:hypothetical protein